MCRQKILFVNGHLRVGGGEKSLVNLLNALDYSKYQVDLLLFEGLGEYKQQIPKEVNIILFDLTKTYGSGKRVIIDSLKQRDFITFFSKSVLCLSGKLYLKSLRLFRLLRITKKDYDCAIAYRVGICAEYVAFCAKAKKKLLWWHHGEYVYDDNTTKRWNKTIKHFDNLVCVSQTARNLVEKNLEFPKENIRVIPNIVDVDNIKTSAIEYNPYAAIKKDIIKIVSVGRFSPEKHMLDALSAAQILINNGIKNFKWFLVGDGEQKKAAEEKITASNLEQYFELTGNLGNPYPYIYYADIFVHPSHVESQGITVLEALALHKPSVVVRSDGTEEFIEDGKNAIKANKKPEDLAAKIEYVINNKDNLNFSANQDRTVNQFLPQNIIERFYDLIK